VLRYDYCCRTSQHRLALTTLGGKKHDRSRQTGSISLISFVVCSGAYAQQQVIGAPAEASNMKLVGTNDLQGAQRLSADDPSSGRPLDRLYRHHGGTDDIPAPVQSADRKGRAERHLDRGCHRSRRRPKYLRPFPGRKENMRPAARRWCASATARRCPKAIATRSILLRTFGGEAHEIWNVADPANRFSSPGSAASRIRTRAGGMRKPHCFLVSGAPDWRAPHDPGLRPQRSG